MNSIRLSLTALACAAALTAHAQVSYTGGSYTQSFNGLGESAQGWANGATLPGWFAFTNVLDVSSALTQLPLQSGPIGNDALASASADRALGAARLPGSTVPTFGLGLVNNSGNTIASFTLSYTGKQFGFVSNERLNFSYGLGSANLTSGGFVDVPSLGFGPLPNTFIPNDGFYATTNVLGTVNLNWQNGQILWLRWTATNFAFSGGLLAIDGVNVVGAVIPEPASALVLAGVLGGSVVARRRRRA